MRLDTYGGLCLIGIVWMACVHTPEPTSTPNTNPTPASPVQKAEPTLEARVEQTGDMAPDASQDTPEIPFIEPAEITATQVVFEAGQLPWAKPNYRVVFHLRAESDMWRESGVFDELFGGRGWEGSRNHRFELDGKKYHVMDFLHAREATEYDSVFHEYKDGLPETGKPWPLFQGAYLPEQLTPGSEPTLHMFEVSHKRFERLMYRMGDWVIEHTKPRELSYFTSRYSPEGEWLRCNAYLTHNYPHNPDTRLERCEDIERYHIPFIEGVYWPGNDPTTQGALPPVTLYLAENGFRSLGEPFAREDTLLLLYSLDTIGTSFTSVIFPKYFDKLGITP